MSVVNTSQRQKIVIVNTGCANISSVRFALERLGVEVDVSDDVKVIKSADKVFLPGVGTAAAAMASIKQKALADTLQTLTQPVLGVCLGMQLMVETSAEGGFQGAGNIDCLNLMPGHVARMESKGVRLPHMGWNTVAHKEESLFKGIPQDTYFYFVHSFAVPEYEHTLASCTYGNTFSAAINKNNFYGVQFHPERSGEAGAQLLTNFVNL
ncbi:imidazole glycerol phosphate synthase subunit HisH [Alteromonas mediterranea]|uniref:Imidazole glycerol phosphate synthase subunit HisH n=2 Tax=Alteromonas mediterranea TaxID=314275 RepID=A0AAC8XKW8_9ALTE|nr:imidazole glycerol phosphate synthase subunit HisH [Alteromonas mediterranea]MBR9782759.1 imidazole glycerol phosphate synthase subunit HisH [Gammaproteobacteria bacterium]AFV86115.1 imidazole glycerol phosphate synthase subunit HisH [Alteromonas mediterranea DE1]AGP82420.1 imidazole glycerol phosphate synthase subunit HisH [Alteromonas mediterranea MED64]AGP98126.1 imidazole glycerol phosphate synthase subunit HisH [Alteromonas mediterranea UM7]AGQ02385.1 imidazole glycerol phosphate synth